MRHLIASVVLVVLLAPGARAQTLLGTTPVLTGLFNAYAPSVLGPRMWIGGWLTPADFPDDRIYRSELVAGEWTFPVPALARADAGVNDPSAVAASGGLTNLYYTFILNSCAPRPNCFLTANFTGVATSANGGDDWTDQGTLIGLDNGLGPCGAWAPSALAVGDEIWLYYHGGNPSFGPCNHPSGTVFRSRLDATGRQRKDTVVVSVPIPVVNVDVSRRPDGLFVMVANSPDLTRIHRFTSADGLAWTRQPDLVDAGVVWIPTPHLTWTDATHSHLWFGTGQVPGNTFIQQVDRQDWSE